MSRISVMVLACALVCGCASTREAEISSSELSFAYGVEGGKPIGLIRAFDDGKRTVLQFVTDPPSTLKVVDALGKPLAIGRIGQYIVLPGLQTQARVVVDSGGPTAVVKALSGTQGVTQGSSTAEAPPVSSESNAVTAARTDLWFIESRMAEIEERLGRKGNKADKAQLSELKARLQRARKVVDGTSP